MSGICLELLHISEVLSDCTHCFLPEYDYDADEATRDNPSSVHSSVTYHSNVSSSYALVNSQDYLDSCGRRISDGMSDSVKERLHDKIGLTLDALLSMTPIVNGQDTIRMAARHLLLSHLKSQENVQKLFFPTHTADAKYEPNIEHKWFDFQQFACLYVCQAICKVKDEYQMYTLLDETRIDEELLSLYTSPHWKKIGFALYTTLFQDIVKDEQTKSPFSAYLDHDRRTWGRLLSERVREKQWLYANLISPVVQGKCTDEEYNRDLNILFVKLHLLDPSTVMPTYDYLRKALPDLNLELVTTNYLGGPLEWSLIRNDVEAALQKPTYPNNNNPRLSMKEIEVFYGLEVLEFIMSDAKDRQLWTGKEPDNRRLSPPSDRCVVM